MPCRDGAAPSPDERGRDPIQTPPPTHPPTQAQTTGTTPPQAARLPGPGPAAGTAGARRAGGARRGPRAALLLAALALAAAPACETPGGARPEARPAGASEADRKPLLSGTRQLTFAGRRAGEGYFGRSGARLVFQSERAPDNPFYQIYLMDLARGDVFRVSPGIGKTTCGWIHPGGGRVLFASTHAAPGAEAEQARELRRRQEEGPRRYAWDYDPDFDLFAVDVDGEGPVGEPRALAPARGYDAEASYSPDGRTVLFASNRHAYDPVYASAFGEAERQRLEDAPSSFVDLYRLDVRTREVERLTDTPGYDGGPFFSADGRRIVWRRFSPDGKRAEIYTMPTEGGEAKQVTRLGVLSWAPFFHPSGDYIVFSTNLQGFGNFELYLVDAAGERDPVRVTRSQGFDGLPAFSPDGATLVWTSQRSPDESSQLFTARWDDAAARRLLKLPRRRRAEAEPLLPLPGRTRPAVEADDLRAHVEALASDATSGRLTGTPGERIATGYVARAFRAVGLEPAGDSGTYFQEFAFTAGVSLGEDNRLEAVRPDGSRSFEVNAAWRPLAFSQTGSFEAAPVVFAGYGLVAPEGEHGAARDDLEGIDVADRWVMVLRDVPSGLSRERKRRLRRYASLRHKAMVARDRGARGILLVAGPHARVESQLPELALDASLARTSVAAVALRNQTARDLLAPSGHDLGALQAALDAGEPTQPFVLDDLRLAAHIDLEQQRRRGRNVVGRLPADAPEAEGGTPAPAVVVGAHVDHLGTGPGQTSLARDIGPDAVHYGADDNASGVAALLEIAEDLAHRSDRGELALERDVVFAAWSGEELGLLGSSHYVQALGNPHDAEEGPASRVAAYLNMDMVGRLEESLALYGVGSSPAWPAAVERANLTLALPLRPQQEGYLPTDSTPFYTSGIPVLSAFTGAHEDYHTPDDVPSKLRYEPLARIARLMGSLALEVAERADAPAFTAVSMPQQDAQRAGLQVYLGTIPDYASSEVEGVRLSGVAEGGPAESAGLRSGDVIVRVGERTVENIYDYTYALQGLEPGEAVEVEVERGSERRTFELVPAARD